MFDMSHMTEQHQAAKEQQDQVQQKSHESIVTQVVCECP